MRKPRQILDQRLKAFFIIFDEKIPDKSLPFIVGAMKQYAEEYHRAELLKLNKSDVISSVCHCEPHTFYEWEKDENKCSQCGKPIYEQTDL